MTMLYKIILDKAYYLSHEYCSLNERINQTIELCNYYLTDRKNRTKEVKNITIIRDALLTVHNELGTFYRKFEYKHVLKLKNKKQIEEFMC